jgi:LysR family glycine cleavage system transcriptional activator
MEGAMELRHLRYFVAVAEEGSLTLAAEKRLHTAQPSLSRQIRDLEYEVGVPLMNRSVHGIELTTAGRAFLDHARLALTQAEAAAEAARRAAQPIKRTFVVISTPPGFTANWLAPRLYRFASAYPEIDVRVSSSGSNANFTTDGVDVAIRNLPIDAVADSALVIEKLIELSIVPVCSPGLIQMHGPLERPEALKRVPLIHDDTLAGRAQVPDWADWFKAAGVDAVDVSRGLRFNSADHALDAAGEGAGVLLAHDVLAYDDLRTGRLVIPVEFALRSGRAYHFVCAKSRREHPHVQAFCTWVKQEVAALDWTQVHRTGGSHVQS